MGVSRNHFSKSVEAWKQFTRFPFFGLLALPGLFFGSSTSDDVDDDDVEVDDDDITTTTTTGAV